MTRSLKKPGMSILVFVILMSSLMLLCTALWKSTTYLVNFSLQKKIYLEKRYYMEGCARWIVQWIKAEWNMIQALFKNKTTLDYQLPYWPYKPHFFDGYTMTLMLERKNINSISVTVSLKNHVANESTLRCSITQNKRDNDIFYAVEQWQINL